MIAVLKSLTYLSLFKLTNETPREQELLLNPHLGPWSVSAETAVGPGDCDDACALRVGQRQLRHWDKNKQTKTETYYIIFLMRTDITTMGSTVILRTVEFETRITTLTTGLLKAVPEEFLEFLQLENALHLILSPWPSSLFSGARHPERSSITCSKVVYIWT